MEDNRCRPIVTVPMDLSFYSNTTSADSKPGGSADGDNNDDDDDGSSPSSQGYPLYLTEDWDSGIGGGLWTTGLALGRYFATSPHFLEEFRKIRDSKNETTCTKPARPSENENARSRSTTTIQPQPVRVLELGSGNGFLGVCLVTAVAVAEANEYNNSSNDDPSDSSSSSSNNKKQQQQHWPGVEIVVTDTAEHLPLMRATIESNLKRILPQIRKQHNRHQTTNTNNPRQESPIPTTEEEQCSSPSCAPIAIEGIARVEEYLWGEDYDFGDKQPQNSQEPRPPQQNNNHSSSFDLIIGSDVAYRDHLHDPLISALEEFSVPKHTVALIGVTMNDTKPVFFEKLHDRGFRYEKLSEQLLGDEFCTSSRQFGVFCISKR